jgi:hypothetical protein
MSDNKLQIRNSTAEFLIFTAQGGDGGIEVRLEDGTIWLSQRLIAELFQVAIPTVNEHLAAIYSQRELLKNRTIRNFRIVRQEGSRTVAREIEHYNLDAIISVGYHQ